MPQLCLIENFLMSACARGAGCIETWAGMFFNSSVSQIAGLIILFSAVELLLYACMQDCKHRNHLSWLIRMKIGVSSEEICYSSPSPFIRFFFFFFSLTCRITFAYST